MPSPTLEEVLSNCYRTGSSVICNPPVLDTDIDYVLLNSPRFNAETLVDLGFTITDHEYNASSMRFLSWRKDNINVILVYEAYDFNTWVICTETAKAFNLLNKEDRINLFHIIQEDRANARDDNPNLSF